MRTPLKLALIAAALYAGGCATLLSPEAERQLSRAADAVVPCREKRHPGLGRRRACQRKHEDAVEWKPAHGGFVARARRSC